MSEEPKATDTKLSASRPTSDQAAHKNAYAGVSEAQSLSDNLTLMHQLLKQKHPFIERIALALYDHHTDQLRTFLYSSDIETPLAQYQAKLSDSPSLAKIYETRTPRVLNDMSVLDHGSNQHTQVLKAAGYQASYTLPMLSGDALQGFIFFNSYKKNVFTPEVLSELDRMGSLAMLLVNSFKSTFNTLLATLRSARSMTHSRDPETGQHIERMSRYSRVIAKALAKSHQLDDEFIEYLYLFAPLHDIGKLAIPDDILLKPDVLNDDEFEVMKTHTSKGFDMINDILSNYGLGHLKNIQMLGNIILYHHEQVDGKGYPKGLRQFQIPLESRIVSVADMFDALTSQRPYKQAWSNEEAYAELARLIGTKLDSDCVMALLRNKAEIEAIQKQFVDESLDHF